MTQPGFIAWFRGHRPDLVIGHVQAMVNWLQEMGAQVPRDTRFFNLNVTERTGPCAGLDPSPDAWERPELKPSSP